MLSVDHAFCERLYLCDFNGIYAVKDKGGSPNI